MPETYSIRCASLQLEALSRIAFAMAAVGLVLEAVGSPVAGALIDTTFGFVANMDSHLSLSHWSWSF